MRRRFSKFGFFRLGKIPSQAKCFILGPIEESFSETNNVRSTLSNKNTLEKVIARTGRNDDLKRLGLINEVSSFRTAKNKDCYVICYYVIGDVLSSLRLVINLLYIVIT